jgi:hypothetical protein
LLKLGDNFLSSFGVLSNGILVIIAPEFQDGTDMAAFPHILHFDYVQLDQVAAIELNSQEYCGGIH